MSDHIVRAVGDLDPERCKGSTSDGPCPNKARIGTDFCDIHGGLVQHRSQQRKEHNGYRVAKWQASIAHHSTPDQIKNLTEEIAILKMLVEEILLQCHDSTALIGNQGTISTLILNISNVINSFDKMQQRLGQLLNKTAITNIATSIVGIITLELKDNPEVLARISEQISTVIANTTNPIKE